MDIKKLLQTFDVLSEGSMKSAEKHEQGPEFTGYWKGKDKATPGKKMVGGESIMPELARQAKEGKPHRELMTDWQEFKEAQEEFVLYIDGKPASKYINHNEAHRDLEYIRSKYPTKRVELKQEICNLKTLPEGRLPDEYVLKQEPEQTANDVLFQTAAQAMVNASREGVQLDTEDAFKQASQVTKIPYVPSQLPALRAQLQKLEQQIAVQKQVRKNQLSREKEQATHQTTPDEERRSQEFFKQADQQKQNRLTIRKEELDEAEIKPVSATVPIQSTQVQPKQNVYVAKTNPAVVNDVRERWARGNDNFEGAIVGVTDTEYTLSDGHENRVYLKRDVEILETKELDEFAPPVESDEDSELHFKNSNPQDVIKVDVPLLIRLLEYAREDAKTDMDLHNVAERLIQLSADGNVLSMDNYTSVVGQTQEDLINELGADNPQMNKQGYSTATPTSTDPEKAAEIVQTNKNLQALKPALASAGVNIDVNKMTQTMAKSDIPGAKLTGTEQQVASQLTPGIADALKDQQAAQLLKQAIQKGQQAQK